MLQLEDKGGLLWWSSGLESTFQCKGHWFDAWSRRIPQLLSPCTATAETHAPGACALQQEKPLQ